ncbi:MAG: EAL domain-containing protein [Lachnospiraceae bacterium]|nr:EAL domain-containing protein [Lachnospiraceae bacterium]
MRWNLDLDACALLITIALMAYYQHRTVLPLVQNHMFFAVMSMSCVVMVTDMVASMPFLYNNSSDIFAAYFFNSLYYIALATFPFVFGLYTKTVVGMKLNNAGGPIFYLKALPYLAVVVIILTSPLNHLIFYLSEDGYFNYGPGRPIMFFETVFYLLYSLVVMLDHRHEVKRVKRYSIYLFLFSAFVGHVVQVYFLPYKQCVSLAVTFGLLIIFLTYQNPEYDRDQKTGMLSEYSLRVVKTEEQLYRKYHPTAMLGFENYQVLSSTYSNHKMVEVAKEISLYLRLLFPRRKIFYMHRGRFLIILDDDMDIFEDRKKIMERFKEPFYVDGAEVWLSPRFVYEGDKEIVKNHSYLTYYNCMRDGLELAMQQEYGGYVLLTDEIIENAVRDRQIDQALRNALDQRNLAVYFQPIYSTKEQRVTAAEALVRIEDPELNIIYPDDFVWRAEKNGSILALGDIVIRKVCEFIKNNDMEKLGLQYIEVNLSPIQCMREQLADEVLSILKEYDVDPHYINLEITESAASDEEVIHRNMDRLLEHGVTFSLDDYGTGYSNLVNVLSLPLHIIKIDKSIVWAYFNDGNDILLKVMKTFEDQSVELVCEGVETKEMADVLSLIGCQFEQGYYYSKPVPEARFLEYLKGEGNDA